MPSYPQSFIVKSIKCSEKSPWKAPWKYPQVTWSQFFFHHLWVSLKMCFFLGIMIWWSSKHRSTIHLLGLSSGFSPSHQGKHVKNMWWNHHSSRPTGIKHPLKGRKYEVSSPAKAWFLGVKIWGKGLVLIRTNSLYLYFSIFGYPHV